jgi:hypothetical protein
MMAAVISQVSPNQKKQDKKRKSILFQATVTQPLPFPKLNAGKRALYKLNVL